MIVWKRIGRPKEGGVGLKEMQGINAAPGKTGYEDHTEEKYYPQQSFNSQIWLQGQKKAISS